MSNEHVGTQLSAGAPPSKRADSNEGADDFMNPLRVTATENSSGGSSTTSLSSTASLIQTKPALTAEVMDSSTIFQQLSNTAPEMRGLRSNTDWSIPPDRAERVAWDVFMLGLVIYSSVHGSYQIAFTPYRGIAGMTAIDWLVDLCFYVDIVINFFTGYDKGFEVVMDRAQIVRHYLRGWFAIDIVATVPWDLLWEVAAKQSGDSGSSNLIQFVRLVKILRMARASRLIMRITASWTINTTYIRVAVFMLYVALSCHLLACFFFLVPDIVECEQDEFAMPLEIPPLGFQPGAIAELNEWWQVGEADGPSVDDVAELASGIGWYKRGACLQGSWRQAYGLEEVCEILGNAGVYHTAPWNEDQLNTLKNCYVALATTTSYKMQLADGTVLQVADVCKSCMTPLRKHTDAFYWALTTMTTVGYGDRNPATGVEIVFVLFSEVFGLCVFCLLLQQINRLGDVFGERIQAVNATKNDVVGFLKDELGSKDQLIANAVRFLNFRASSLSGHSFHGNDDKFSMLSPGITREIQIAIYRPVLQRVRSFGWNQEDEKEEAALQDLFDRIDTSNDGSIEVKEARQIFEGMEIDLTQQQLEQVFAEMDLNGGGGVTSDEFKNWWFIKKTGKPRTQRCPSEFLDAMCTKIYTRPFAIDEQIVAAGEYSKALVVILRGSVAISRGDDTSTMSATVDEYWRDNVERVIAAEDREPCFGFATCLDHAKWVHIRECMGAWTVRSREYVDTAWVHRSDILDCFRAAWPEGPATMATITYGHYGIKEPLEELASTELDAEKSALRESTLNANAPEWAKTMQDQLMRRIDCIEKHMDETQAKIVELLKENRRDEV